MAWSKSIKTPQRIREALSEYGFIPSGAIDGEDATTEDWGRDHRRVSLTYRGSPETGEILFLVGAYAIDRGEYVELSLA